MRTAHQVLKCGTQVPSRTRARVNQWRGRKKSRWSNHLFPQNIACAPDNVEYMEKVLLVVRQKLGRPEEDKMEQINTNAKIWRLLMTACTKAAVHLRKDYGGNLSATKNTDSSEIKHLFSISLNLIRDQEDEIFGVSTIDWDQTCYQVFGSKSIRLFRFGTLSRRQNCRMFTICTVLE